MILTLIKYRGLLLSGFLLASLVFMGQRVGTLQANLREQIATNQSIVKTYQLAVAQATTANERKLREQAERNTKAMLELSYEHENRTRELRSSVDRFMRLNASKDRSGTNGTGVSSETAATNGPTTAGEGAFVPYGDLLICAENTSKAISWQEYYYATSD